MGYNVRKRVSICKRNILEVQIQKIMEFFETNDELTRLDVEILLDVKKSRARDLIIYLLENNFISKIGKYKSTKYIKNQS